MNGERGNVLVVMAFGMVALAILVAVLIDLDQVRQAQVAAETAAQAAVTDGARLDLDASTLYPLCPPGDSCTRSPRASAILAGDALRIRVRAALARDLESIAYLLYKATPLDVANRAEIAVVNPHDGSCERNPFDDVDERCYYKPFVALRVRVPLKALWGGVPFEYPVMAVGAASDDVSVQRRATPVPTWTPIGPIPTFPAPRPTCDPSNCG
jgi:hypothetical protein